MIIATDFSQLIGRTPMLELNRLFPDSPARILAKLENMNPMSVKDRAVLGMIRGAIKQGRITPGTEVVEATSGNTGIAIASLGAVLGFKTKLFMSELCSVERQQILCAYGARIVITPGAEHTKGARARAIAYCQANPETTFFLNQHGNPDNGRAHELTTGPEIWEQTQGEVDTVILGMGTCGTVDGLSRYFKRHNPKIQIVGFEPAASPVYSGGAQGKHKIIGIGPGLQTENFLRSRDRVDEIITVSDQDAYYQVNRIAKTEGLLVGPSSGAAAWVVGEILKRPESSGKTMVCLFYDTGERYLSAEGLFSRP